MDGVHRKSMILYKYHDLQWAQMGEAIPNVAGMQVSHVSMHLNECLNIIGD